MTLPMRNHQTRRMENIRTAVYNKFDGHCAYCGKKIQKNHMQIDHKNALLGQFDIANALQVTETVDKYSFENLFPSCRTCNVHKSAMTIEEFRDYLTKTLPKTVMKYDRYFNLLDAYGLVEFKTKPIVFYFEQEHLNKSK